MNPDEPTTQTKKTTAAEQFLNTLTKVLRDQELYPKDHPQLQAKREDLHASLQNLFIEDDERIFVFFEDQIYIDDLLIGRGDEGLGHIGKLFLKKRVEVLHLHQGLSIQELTAVVAFLSDPQETEATAPPHFQSHHIAIGKLEVNQDGKPEISKIAKKLGAATLKTGQKVEYTEESKVLKEIYVDWKTAQKGFVKNVGKIMDVLEKSLYSNFSSLIPLGDLKSYDEYTYIHAINLSILTMAQAECLGYSKEAIHAFGMGAVLHDVGKTEVSIEVLHKKGRYTEEEFQEMKSHPLRGAVILMQYPEIPRVASIVAYEHHLKYDLTGYPDVKHHHPQHIGSRLTAISDQFDAMRANRPYRAAMEAEKIMDIMEKDKGTGLDPDLFDRFAELLKHKKVI